MLKKPSDLNWIEFIYCGLPFLVLVMQFFHASFFPTPSLSANLISSAVVGALAIWFATQGMHFNIGLIQSKDFGKIMAYVAVFFNSMLIYTLIGGIVFIYLKQWIIETIS